MIDRFFDLYKTPQWHAYRRRRINEVGNRCEKCDVEESERTLQVHHIFYFHGWKPWEYPHEFTVCLCKVCHEDVHDLASQIKKIISRNWKDMRDVFSWIRKGEDRGFYIDEEAGRCRFKAIGEIAKEAVATLNRKVCEFPGNDPAMRLKALDEYYAYQRREIEEDSLCHN